MARRRRRPGAAVDAELEIAPMIDIVFQLLIFFMVAGTIAPMANLLVPKAVTAKDVDPVKAITLCIAPGSDLGATGGGATSGEVIFDLTDPSRHLTVAQAVDHVVERIKNRRDSSERKVIIRAHEAVLHGTVQQIVDGVYGKVPDLGDQAIEQYIGVSKEN